MLYTNLLQVERVSFKLQDKLLLNNISFALKRKECLVVLGPNGSSKSTLLQAVLGLLPYSGKIYFNGQDLRQLTRLERARLIAYVPQRSALDSPLKVKEVVAAGRFARQALPDILREWWQSFRLPRKLRTSLGDLRQQDRESIQQALSQVGISHLAECLFTELSHGERQRVLLARALATEAKLIVLDEPTASLDVACILQLFKVLSELVEQGLAVLIALHQFSEACMLAHKALLLQHGEVVASGQVSEVIAAQPIGKVYGVELLKNVAYGYRQLSAGKLPLAAISYG